MLAPTQIKKPENWQDFESLCKILWGEVWKCTDSIKRNGRSGQNQCGVDVYGIPEGKNAYFGIQCKGKDDYTKALLTTKEVDTEIEKAKGFKPLLKKLIFATTANKDVSIEEYIRTKNIEHLEHNLFEVDIMSWEDIVDLLKRHKVAYNWYMNNCQFNDVADIDISFEGEQVCTIHPEYIRTTKRTVLRSKPENNWFKEYSHLLVTPMPNLASDPFRGEHDYRWQKVGIQIENSGSVTIDDYKLYLFMDTEKIELDTLYNYVTDWRISDATRAQINQRIDRERDTFISDYGIIFEPNKSLLLSDSAFFRFSIKADDDVKTIPIKWKFISRDYTKTGNLTINIEHFYIDKDEVIEVDNKTQLREPEVEIVPRKE